MRSLTLGSGPLCHARGLRNALRRIGGPLHSSDDNIPLTTAACASPLTTAACASIEAYRKLHSLVSWEKARANSRGKRAQELSEPIAREVIQDMLENCSEEIFNDQHRVRLEIARRIGSLIPEPVPSPTEWRRASLRGTGREYVQWWLRHSRRGLFQTPSGQFRPRESLS